MERPVSPRAYEPPVVEDYEELQFLLGPARRFEPREARDRVPSLVEVSEVALP